MSTATFKIWRGDGMGEFRDYTTEVGEGRVVLGRGQRDAEANVHDAAKRVAVGKTGDDRADESISVAQGLGHRRLLEFSGEEKDQTLQTATARRAGRHLANAAGGHRSCSGVPEMH